MRIKKTAQTTTTQAQIVDSYSTSKIDGYSCDYGNKNFADIGTVIYETDNPSANQTITLTDSIANYKRFKIYAYDEEIDNNYTTEVFNNNNSTINFIMQNGKVGYAESSFHLTFTNVSISGTTLTKGYRTYMNDLTIGPKVTGGDNYRYAMIQKIIAYKD